MGWRFHNTNVSHENNELAKYLEKFISKCLTEQFVNDKIFSIKSHEGVASVDITGVTSQHTGRKVWLVLNCETHV